MFNPAFKRAFNEAAGAAVGDGHVGAAGKIRAVDIHLRDDPIRANGRMVPG